ncbi:MAG TPA: DUF1579 domain-containing protein [Thermoanaerobaculia bacterium]|nr:DUF1579 domain-containing protein [Thermoanaerobaculia bacterium]
MKLKVLAAATALMIVAGLPAMAGESKSKGKKSAAHDEQAMMAAWMKAMTPGDAHSRLKDFEGSWSASVSSWMQPGAPPMISTGSSEHKMVLGGRYLEQRFTGSFMDQPFEGVGYTGYDNINKKYVSSWMDNMSTAPMMVSGKVDKDGMKLSGMVSDPMTGKLQAVKETLTVVDSDHHKMEMWGPAPNGKMFKMMEIHYKRK